MSRASDAQFNAGAVIRVPVTKEAEITVTSYPNYHNYTVAGTPADADTVNYTATAVDVATGYIEIVATDTAYLYSIKAVYVTTPAGSGAGSGFTSWTADLTAISNGKAVSSDTAFSTPNGTYSASKSIDSISEMLCDTALLVYSSNGGLRLRNSTNAINYNGGVANAFDTTTEGEIVTANIDRYAGIDISKLSTSGNVKVTITGIAKPTSNNIQVDKPGQVLLLDQNKKVLAAITDLRTNSNSETYTNTTVSIEKVIDASKVSKVTVVFSRGGMVCDKSASDTTASNGGGIDINSIKVEKAD